MKHVFIVQITATIIVKMAMEQTPEIIPQNTTEIILESISDGVFTINPDWQITTFNRAAEEITGVARSEAIGRHCWEVFRSNMCEARCALRQTMEDKKSSSSTATFIINSEQKKIPISISTALLKDANGKILGGVETFRDMSLVEQLRKELDGKFQIGDMVSRNHEMKKLFSIVPQIAESDSSVLVLGETGTGKELLSRAIHNTSARKRKPFIAINCGAFPDELLESELFGYKAGAFTHAVKDKTGYFAAAEGGTILLDEIGETSPAFQVRLLRVLEEKEYVPLGSVKPIKSNVRVLAATNRNLLKEVQSGKFREDLYYRINVVQLKLPALRLRKEDIPLLTELFIEKMNRIKDRAIKGIDEEALAHVMAWDYPGNIRELQNIIERASILCPSGIIQARHLPSYLIQTHLNTQTNCTLDRSKNNTEIETIQLALKRNHNNRLAAAKDLGIHKSTLFRKIKKLGISLPAVDGRSKMSLLS